VLVLLTLTLALGSVLPGIAAGAIAVVGFGLGWMAGVLAGVAAALGVEGLRGVAEASRWILPTDGLWRGVIYGLEPPLVVLIAAGRAPALANANPFYATEPPAPIFVIWSIVWMALVLGGATWWFERRDL
jgi:ABC-2 type transport system permease protein